MKRLEESSDFWFIIFSSLLFFFLRLPSLFEPLWYGDEGIYQTIGLAINRGAILYRDIWDNKPPLLYYLYSFFGSDQFLLRLTSLTIGAVGIIFFFLLARKLFAKPIIYRTCTLLFTVLFGLPLIEGNIANAENFMVPLIITASYFAYSSIQKNRGKQGKLLFISGLILGICFLFKIVSIFDFSAFFLFLFIYDFPEKHNIGILKNQVKKKIIPLAVFAISFIFPFFLTFVYFSLHHISRLYISSIFISNVGYVGYGNNFIIPQGFLILKLILLSIVLLTIFIKRRLLKLNASIFILIWVAFALFDAFFSQRNYPHYVLTFVPAFCLLFGLIFINRFSKLIALIFILVFLIVTGYFSFYFKNIGYYLNYVSFVTGNKSVSSYQSFFDSKTPRDYEIASFLNANLGKEDNIFIWGNNAQVYKLTNTIPPGKYTVSYHMIQYPDGITNTIHSVSNKNPRFVIIMPGQIGIPIPLYNYHVRIEIEGAIIYERNT